MIGPLTMAPLPERLAGDGFDGTAIGRRVGRGMPEVASIDIVRWRPVPSPRSGDGGRSPASPQTSDSSLPSTLSAPRLSLSPRSGRRRRSPVSPQMGAMADEWFSAVTPLARPPRRRWSRWRARRIGRNGWPTGNTNSILNTSEFALLTLTRARVLIATSWARAR
jgi:hypothetical protein